MMERMRALYCLGMATKREKRLNAALVVALVLMVASMGVLAIWGYSNPVFILIFFVMGVLIPGLDFALKAAHRAALGHLREIEFLLCPACQSDLQGSVPVGRCPGCGRYFNQHAVSIEWIERYERLLKRLEE